MSDSDHNISIEDAFDKLMADSGYETTPPADSSATLDTEDTTVDANANTDTTKVDDSTTASADTTATDQDSTIGTPAGDVDWKEEASKWEQKFKSFEGRMQSDLARRREEEDKRQQQYLEILSRVQPSAQQQAQQAAVDKLNKFKQLREDYPEIAEAMEEYIQNEVAQAKVLVGREISSRMEPVISNLSQTQMDSHLGRIQAKHPDALEVRKSPKFTSWVESMPSFAQAGAMHVIKLGTADEVIALLDQYKSSINTNQTQNTVKPTTNENNTNAVSPEIAAALRSGLAVQSGKSKDPTTATKAVDNDDFNAAWEEAVKQYGIK